MPFHIRLFLTLSLACWFLITLLVLCSGPAYAEFVKALNNQTDPTLYVDSDTIRRNGTVVRWWELLDHTTVRNRGRHIILVDDGSKRIRLRWRANSGACDGGLLWQYGKWQGGFCDFTQSNWVPVEPESIGQSLWKAACGKE